MEDGADGPCWAALPSDALHHVFSCGPLRGDMRSWAMGAAACRAWRAALHTFQPDSLIVAGGLAWNPREAALLVHWFALHPPTRLQHLVLPPDCSTHAVLAIAINTISCRELRSLRMSIRCDQFYMLHTRQLSCFTGLTSLHLTLHSSVLVDGLLHKQLCKLSGALQDLYLATPQGEPQPTDGEFREAIELELLVPLPYLTRLCLGRPFARSALDCGLMPQLQRLQLRTFRGIIGAATLSQCTQLSELEVFGSAAKKILPAVPAASLRHLALHYAPGAEKHCPAALTALTALRCLALRGKHSCKLLPPTDPLPSLQALFLEDCSVYQVFHGPAKLFSQLRVLHLAGTTARELKETVIYPGTRFMEKMRQDGLRMELEGLAFRYCWIEPMLQFRLRTGHYCAICPLESGGEAPELDRQHVELPQHAQQLALFQQFMRTYKESVALPLALVHKLHEEFTRQTTSPMTVGELKAQLPASQKVVDLLTDLERQRAWSDLDPLLDAISGLWSELFGVAGQLQGASPAFSLGALADASKREWAGALAAADACETLMNGLARHQATTVLPQQLVELGLAPEKPRRKLSAGASEREKQEQAQQRQAAARAAAVVAGWAPAGASIVAASFEGWVRITRMLGM